MVKSVTTTLMFTGEADDALALYSKVFPDMEIGEIQRFGKDEGQEGKIKYAPFTINGQHFRCFDSPPVHDFTFTPSVSLFLEMEDEAELDRAFDMLSKDGGVMMPPGNYGFSRKFAWINDRFGVSWQLNLF